MPHTRVGWLAASLVVTLVPVSWLLGIWSPEFLAGAPGVSVATPDRSRDLLGVLWQVHVAVAAIALPLLVFSIDLAGNRPGVAATTQEVLIRESFIFPILAFGLALAVRVGVDFIWFAHPPVVAFDLALFSALVLFTIFAFLRSLQLIFSRARLQQKAMSLLGERMDEVVDQSLETRVANGMLLEWGATLGLAYHPLTDRRGRGSFLNLNSSKRGRITDIQLDRLRSLVDSLPRLESSASPTSDVLGRPGSASPVPTAEIVWLRKRVGDLLTDESSELLRIDETAFHPFDRSDFERVMDGAIKVESSVDDRALELRNQIAFLRDSLTEGIAGGRTGQVEDALDIYQELSATFLRKLKELENSYSLALVQTQESWLFARGWVEVEWVMDAVRQAIDDATSTTNTSILLDVLFLPTRLANTAFRFRDLKMFHSFISLIPYSYLALAERPDGRTRELGTDRAWRYLSERLDLYLLPALEDADSETELRNNLPYAQTAMGQFSHLLKASYEERQPRDFERFATALKGQVRHWRDRSAEIHSVEWRLEAGDLNEVESGELERELALLRSLEEAHASLVARKSVIQFGLVAWVLFDYSKGRRTADEILQYMGQLELPSDLGSLWRLSRSAATYGEWDDLEWRSWELGAKSEGEAHFIEITSYLYLAFLLRSLTLIAKGDDSSLPESEEFRHLAASGGQLMTQLAGIEQEAEKWKPFLDDAAVAAIPELRRRLLEASEQAEKKERQALIDAPIDEAKKAGVIALIEAGWKEEGLFRRLLKDVGAYEVVDQEPPEEILPFGLNQLDTKHAYVIETDVHTTDWGEEWGRSLARGENEMVVGALHSQLPVFETAENETMEESVRNALDRLRQRELKPVILINRSWRAESAIERSSDFEWPDNRQDPDLLGFLDDAPVYNLHGQGPEEVLVVDLGAALRWKQFPPPDLSKDQIVLEEVVAVAIEEINEERAQELLDRWSEEGAATNWTLEGLQERVGLRVFERFKIEIPNAQAGFRVLVARAEEEQP